ncbi:Solute carrier family 25 member 40 [Brachionus plicatilis]|uniref:Solute carrier family 25 member 40 n=1 Tax=Brachionus plicatilis TaxID=10195 RepID=A0A3M7Q463_BRAPC|nr:Solute carrier family 25 member 40 [Brachionus plicatilis]
MNDISKEKKISEVKKRPHKMQQVISSSCGALVTSLLMTPLDVVKIRLQSQNHMKHRGDCFFYRNGLMDHLCTCFNGPDSWYNRKIPGGRYHGTLDAMVKIAKVEGITSLWSGLPPTLFMAFPQVVLYFTTYEESKRMLGYHEILNPNPVIPVLSGGLARMFAVTAVSPLELIRTKIQSEKLKYKDLIDAVKFAIKEQGVKSLYRGWVSTVLRDVPFSMIYWLNYESLKSFFLKRQHNKSLSSVSVFFCGATAGSVAALITCPLDVVKTYRQVQLGEKDVPKHARKTWKIIKQIYRIKGVSGLFAGATPRVTKVAMSCAIMITSFEYFKNLFEHS